MMGEVLTSSGALAASAVVLAQQGGIMSVIATADGTNAATVHVWDSENSTTSGKTKLATVIVDAGLVYEQMSANRLIKANRGIYVEISGTGAGAIIHYQPL
jgi:hypothetical protein